MKQTIEIDVPDGMEIFNVHESDVNVTEKIPQYHSKIINITFKKKEPEFIEVLEYLAMCGKDLTVGVTIIGCPKHSQPEEIEKYGNFVRWIDKEPRKVEI